MAEENYMSTSELSPLEQEVLDEYERLANNMKQVTTPLTLRRTTRDDARYAKHAVACTQHPRRFTMHIRARLISAVDYKVDFELIRFII